MKQGTFNMEDYLNKLHEGEEVDAEHMGGNLPAGDKDGIIIPDTNKKTFNWLKNEYRKAAVEVKVEMKIGDKKFEPGYDLQTDLKSVKNFKPGMYGEIKTGDTGKNQNSSKTGTQNTPINNKKEEGSEETKNDKSPKKQAMNVDLKSKKDDKK